MIFITPEQAFKHSCVTKLKDFSEYNEWHHETIYEHTITVYQNMRKITANPMFHLAAIFHDIGKPETLKNNSCPGHEAKGADIFASIFGIETQEKQTLAEIIRRHGEIHSAIKTEEALARFFQKPYSFELLALGYTDTLGSHLQNTRPQEYQKRIRMYRRLLELH